MWYKFCRMLAQVYFAVFFHLRAYGQENVPQTGGVLFASNHQSFLDPILIALGLTRTMSFIARRSLFRNPLFGALIRSLGAFPISHDSADVAAIRQGAAILAQGGMLNIFPEGTRTRDGAVGPFRGGFLVLAKKARVPVVPVAVVGADKAWPRHKKLFRFRSVQVVYGKPISPDEMLRMGREKTAEVIREQVIQMKQDLEQKKLRVRRDIF